MFSFSSSSWLVIDSLHFRMRSQYRSGVHLLLDRARSLSAADLTASLREQCARPFFIALDDIVALPYITGMRL
jgi:hypothetical protein